MRYSILLLSLSYQTAVSFDVVQSRRRAMQSLVSGLASTGLLQPSFAAEQANTFKAYQVVPDASASLSPSLVSLDPNNFLGAEMLSKGGALWLGEHHNSAKDHLLQAQILRTVHKKHAGPTAVGLEQVQIKFQPVLDDYIKGKISLNQMKMGVEWETRWTWPFEAYEPVFTTARELGIPLIALNVNSEEMSLVEKAGLPGLSQTQLSQYIPDR
jgi:uncharacterized iron-regulated protein